MRAKADQGPPSRRGATMLKLAELMRPDAARVGEMDGREMIRASPD